MLNFPPFQWRALPGLQELRPEGGLLLRPAAPGMHQRRPDQAQTHHAVGEREVLHPAAEAPEAGRLLDMVPHCDSGERE